MSFRCGIIGLPNVGKSSFFNFLTKSDIAKVGNFPFCTISPNSAKVPFMDYRMQKLCQYHNPKLITYSLINIVDIAGLVKNAHEGHGMGNQFLSNIADMDILIMLVRCFRDDNIIHVEDDINPQQDIETILTELKLYDINKLIELSNRKPQAQKLTKQLLHELENNLPVTDNPYNLLSVKPILLLGNGADEEFLQELYKYQKQYTVHHIDLQKLHYEDTSKIFIHIFQKLNIIHFFTAGEQEVKAWSINQGLTAQIASGKIHSDFQKKIKKVKIIPYESFQNNNKTIAKIYNKDYIMQDGDIAHFMI